MGNFTVRKKKSIPGSDTEEIAICNCLEIFCRLSESRKVILIVFDINGLK